MRQVILVFYAVGVIFYFYFLLLYLCCYSRLLHTLLSFSLALYLLCLVLCVPRVFGCFSRMTYYVRAAIWYSFPVLL
jgi:hypothetical protein